MIIQSNDCYHRRQVLHRQVRVIGEERKEMIDVLDLDRSSVLLCLPPKNRARRARTYFDDRAIQILEHAFLQEQYPDIHRREQLSNEIGTTEARVQVREKRKSLQKMIDWFL